MVIWDIFVWMCKLVKCTHSVSFSWKWPISIGFCFDFDFIFVHDSNEFIRTCFDRLKANAFETSFYGQFETKFFENYIYDDNFQNEMKASGILSRNGSIRHIALSDCVSINAFYLSIWVLWDRKVFERTWNACFN